MDAKTKNELIDRLWLWAHSIEKTKELLNLSRRSKIGENQSSQISERDLYIQKLNEFVKKQPDYKPGTMLISQRQKFNEIYPRQFPTWSECVYINEACIELAIVYFCQIFNDGFGQENSASKNNKSFRNEHLTILLSKVFMNEESLNKFTKLKDIILTARDKMIGHADADAYSISHGIPISTMKAPRQIWSEIDFDFWISFLEPLRIATYNYANEIKIKNYNV